MKKPSITSAALSLLLLAFVACNDSDIVFEQQEQENLEELPYARADLQSVRCKQQTNSQLNYKTL